MIYLPETLAYILPLVRLSSPFLRDATTPICWPRSFPWHHHFLLITFPTINTTCQVITRTSSANQSTKAICSTRPSPRRPRALHSTLLRAPAAPSARLPTLTRTGPKSRILPSVGGYRTELPNATTVCELTHVLGIVADILQARSSSAASKTSSVALGHPRKRERRRAPAHLLHPRRRSNQRPRSRSLRRSRMVPP